MEDLYEQLEGRVHRLIQQHETLKATNQHLLQQLHAAISYIENMLDQLKSQEKLP